MVSDTVKKGIIFDFQSNVKSAVDDIRSITRALDDLKIAQNKINDEYKSSGKLSDGARANWRAETNQIRDHAAVLRAQRRDLKWNVKDMEQQIDTLKEQESSWTKVGKAINHMKMDLLGMGFFFMQIGTQLNALFNESTNFIGISQRMADVVGRGLGEAVADGTARWQEFKLELLSRLAPYLPELINNFIDLTDRILGLVDGPMGPFIKQVIATALVFAPLISSVSLFMLGLVSTGNVIAFFGKGLIWLTAHPIALVIAGLIALATIIITTLTSGSNEFVDFRVGVTQSIIGVIGGLTKFVTIIQAALATIEALVVTFKDMFIASFDNIIYNVQFAWNDFWSKIVDSVAVFLKSIGNMLGPNTLFGSMFIGAGKAATDYANLLIEKNDLLTSEHNDTINSLSLEISKEWEDVKVLMEKYKAIDGNVKLMQEEVRLKGELERGSFNTAPVMPALPSQEAINAATNSAPGIGTLNLTNNITENQNIANDTLTYQERMSIIRSILFNESKDSLRRELVIA